MTFLEGAFLAGLLTAGIPFLVHLFGRKKKKRVPFPSLRFLRDVEVRTARRTRIQHWAVLLLRSLLLAALALALARPVLRRGPLGRGVASRVFVVDNSLSMDARRGGVSALQSSLLAVRELVRRTGAADRAAVIPLHGKMTPLTESRPDIEKALAAIAPTYRDSPIIARVEEAFRILEKESNPIREVYLFSDLQASALGARAPGTAGRSAEPPEGVTLFLLEPAADGAANIAVAGGEALYDRGLVRARILARGGEALARLRFSVDGKPVAERSLKVPGGGEGSVLFHVPQLPAGLHRAEVRSGDDVLPRDNAAGICLDVREPIEVLVARDPAASRVDPAYYVARALAAARRLGEGLKVRLVETGTLASADLSRTDVVFLLEPARIDAPTDAALERFVLSGGGLFLSTGARQPPGAFEALARGKTDLRPALLESVVRAGDAPLRISSWKDAHPVWSPLVSVEPPLRPDVPAFAAAWKVSPLEGAEVLAEFSGGDPALVLRLAGKGKVLLFASAMTTEWGNLPVRYIFAPWVHSIARYLAPGRSRPQVVATGTRLVVRHPSASGFAGASIDPPSGEPRRVPAISRTPRPEAARPPSSKAREPALEADLGRLQRPGVYVLEERFPTARRKRVLVAACPEAESDLAAAGEDRLRELFGDARRVRFSRPRDAVSAVLSITVGSELKPYLLLLVLGLLLVEPLLANRTAFRRGGRGVSAP